MGPQRFVKVKSDDRDLNLVQDAVKRALDSITSNPLLSGHLMKQVALTTGSNLVNHGLGRNYVSFLAGNLSAPATLSTGKSPNPALFINVIASAPCSADLYPY